jgi:hypothetical protein
MYSPTYGVYPAGIHVKILTRLAVYRNPKTVYQILLSAVATTTTTTTLSGFHSILLDF